MYCRHFGLQQEPFKLTPDTQRFFPGGQRGAVLEALEYAVLSREGIVKLVGEVGSGKTMLCRMLAARLPETVEVVYLANPNLSPDDILRAIALELGLKIKVSARRVDVCHAIQRYLLDQHARNRQVVLFVEEAQSMPFETFEEIRFLSNLETSQDKLLQIVLFGQPELDQRLAAHDLRQLRDRITHSITLSPLTVEETRAYVEFRLRSAGYQGGEIFARGLYWIINRASAGLMRRVNTLVDKALLAAYAEGSAIVTRKHIKRALNDSEFHTRRSSLQRLSPWGIGMGLALIGLASYAVVPVSEQAADVPAPVAEVQAPMVSQPVVTSTPAPLDHSLPHIIAATQAALESADSGYTIQLLITQDASTAGLEKLLRNPALEQHLDQLYIYPVKVNGKQRWNVLYGNYGDQGAAQTALQSMPAVLRQHQPYLRSLRAAKSEMAPPSLSDPRDDT